MPSESAVYRSIDAAWNYLVNEAHIPQNRIVIFGRSIGSGPSVDLASRPHICPAAVVLQSPLASGAWVLLGRIGILFRFFDIFANYEKIHRIQCKTFIMHGSLCFVTSAFILLLMFKCKQEPQTKLFHFRMENYSIPDFCIPTLRSGLVGGGIMTCLTVNVTKQWQILWLNYDYAPKS